MSYYHTFKVKVNIQPGVNLSLGNGLFEELNTIIGKLFGITESGITFSFNFHPAQWCNNNKCFELQILSERDDKIFEDIIKAFKSALERHNFKVIDKPLGEKKQVELVAVEKNK